MTYGKVLRYNVPHWLTAFTTGKDSGVEDMGLQMEELALPRQTHSDHVLWVDNAGRPEDTDAVITDRPGLCVCVKTADCIPVLLYDERQRVVAAVHAGWRGTVARIVEKTVCQMNSSPQDLRAIIGPGISLESFEVGDEVFDAFSTAGFLMNRIACHFLNEQQEKRWHIDLWEANRWVLEECGVQDVFVAGICTMKSPYFYSARRETIHTGRNMNGIMINGA